MTKQPTVAVVFIVGLVAASCTSTSTSGATTSAGQVPSTSTTVLSVNAVIGTTEAPSTVDPGSVVSFASQISTDSGPVEWAWDATAQPDPLFASAFDAGQHCYGSSNPPPLSPREVRFLDGTFAVSVGLHETPNATISGADGGTDLGNPFGEDAWLCTIASDGETLLAVGSEVWWSTNGYEWNLVEAFVRPKDSVGTSANGSSLVWSAVGPLGYVVLGASANAGWFSPDLETWHRIPVDGGPGYSERGWFGPGNVTISDQTIVVGTFDDGAWVGTLVPDRGSG
jgi:hypothetical protein